jgi:hypothetical protein
LRVTTPGPTSEQLYKTAMRVKFLFMRRRLQIAPRHLVLLLCALALAALVYAEGWTWPLKVAAVMIPVSLLVG